jgi:hypothetical protein
METNKLYNNRKLLPPILGDVPYKKKVVLLHLLSEAHSEHDLSNLT